MQTVVAAMHIHECQWTIPPVTLTSLANQVVSSAADTRSKVAWLHWMHRTQSSWSLILDYKLLIIIAAQWWPAGADWCPHVITLCDISSGKFQSGWSKWWCRQMILQFSQAQTLVTNKMQRVGDVTLVHAACNPHNAWFNFLQHGTYSSSRLRSSRIEPSEPHVIHAVSNIDQAMWCVTSLDSHPRQPDDDPDSQNCDEGAQLVWRHGMSIHLLYV